jgi:hypothetical protein
MPLPVGASIPLVVAMTAVAGGEAAIALEAPGSDIIQVSTSG